MKAILVTYDKFPDMDAGAVRERMIANMLRDRDYDVMVVSMGPYTGKRICEIEGIKYISYRFKNEKKISKILAYMLFPYRLKMLLNKYNCDICIHTQVEKNVLNIMKKYCKKHKATIVYDAVEWFSPEQFKNKEKAFGYRKNNEYNLHLIDEQHKVISISRYLEKHFINRNIENIYMPVVMDINQVNADKNIDDDKVRIVYAGSPGKKDYLKVIVDALYRLDTLQRKRISFVIIGCTKLELINICGIDENILLELKEMLDVKGRISREKVIDEYKNADFSIFIRSQKQRYAMAGFPTKFVESISTSTPVICNLTSDLKEYMIDCVNGIVVKDETVESCYEAFEKVLLLDKALIKTMQQNARKMAERKFDYHKYTAKVVNFMEREKKND